MSLHQVERPAAQLESMRGLFDIDNPIVSVAEIAGLLDQNHYLGAAKRGIAWSDEFGVLVLAKPTSRTLPKDGTWLELTRWCLSGEKNGGSQQWARVQRWIYENHPEVTTIVSYSDPSVGHTGALYRACNWLWAPTWLRLRPPPSGNGSWQRGKVESVKDRWVFPLRPDAGRWTVLQVNDSALKKTMPEAEYRDPKIKRGRVVRGTGGGAYQEVIHNITCDLDEDCQCVHLGMAA
jgi:hypothetical protein